MNSVMSGQYHAVEKGHLNEYFISTQGAGPQESPRTDKPNAVSREGGLSISKKHQEEDKEYVIKM